MAYSNKVLDHYNNPRNVGSFDQKDRSVGTGLVGAPECGDVLKLQIKVDPITGRIEDARFKTFGCGSAIASSSLATEWLRGKSIDEALAIKNTAIVEELSLPPVKPKPMPASTFTNFVAWSTTPYICCDCSRPE
jgi:nitrogen fixation NifU-like protein